MSVKQCRGCNGVYATIQGDGSTYAHVCPPGTPAGVARNENPPDTTMASKNAVIAAGAGIQVAGVVPPSLQPLAGL